MKQAKDEQLNILKKALENEQRELIKHQNIVEETQDKLADYPWWGSNKIRREMQTTVEEAKQEVMDIQGYITSLQVQIDKIQKFVPQTVTTPTETKVSTKSSITTPTQPAKQRVRTDSLYSAESNYLQNLIQIDPNHTPAA